MVFPWVAEIEIVNEIGDAADAVIVMECGDVKRPGIEGAERGYVINIDHHPGNVLYGALNWMDLVGRRVRRDGVRSRERARCAAHL